MKMVVAFDLFVTMILPASLFYVGCLMFFLITKPEMIDRFIVIFLIFTFSLQMVSFLIRSRWDYLWWFFVFCIGGIPVFYFILPIYAFINMDDFSWGQIQKEAKQAEKDHKSGPKRRDSGEFGDDSTSPLSNDISSGSLAFPNSCSNYNRLGRSLERRSRTIPSGQVNKGGAAYSGQPVSHDDKTYEIASRSHGEHVPVVCRAPFPAHHGGNAAGQSDVQQKWHEVGLQNNICGASRVPPAREVLISIPPRVDVVPSIILAAKVPINEVCDMDTRHSVPSSVSVESAKLRKSKKVECETYRIHI